MKTNISIFVAVLALAFPGIGHAGFGVGALPLTQKAVSMWVAREDGEAVLLVYFTGAPGWHNRRWQTQSEIGSTPKPTVHRLVSDDITLEIATSADVRTFTVQKREFAAEKANVFVVRDADAGPANQRIEPIGRFVLAGGREQPVAAYVIERYPQIRDAIEK